MRRSRFYLAPDHGGFMCSRAMMTSCWRAIGMQQIRVLVLLMSMIGSSSDEHLPRRDNLWMPSTMPSHESIAINISWRFKCHDDLLPCLAR
jgi:hypothetical protein